RRPVRENSGRSKNADAEVKGARRLPGALLPAPREQAVEHAIDVESVVEHQRADRCADAETAAERVAELEQVDAGRIGPEIAGVQEQRRLHVAAERDAELGAWIHEHVAAADHDLVDAEARGG